MGIARFHDASLRLSWEVEFRRAIERRELLDWCDSSPCRIESRRAYINSFMVWVGIGAHQQCVSVRFRMRSLLGADVAAGAALFRCRPAGPEIANKC